jgi:lauroyl/myristoyl acyltransferase
MTGSPYQQEQQAVIDATLSLFGVSMTESLMIPIPHTEPQVWIVAGDLSEIRKLLDAAEQEKKG